MIKIFLISLFASVAFALSELSDKCEEGMKKCRPDEYYNKTITMPETEEELEAYCELSLKYFECRLEAQSGCENDLGNELRRWGEEIYVHKHICNEESELYKNLLLALPCLKLKMDAEETFDCYSMYVHEPTIEKFEKILNNAGITDVSKGDECFPKYFFDTCMIGSSGAVCGTVARNVILDITELHIEARQDTCSATIKGKEIYSYMAPEMEILYIESEALLKEMYPEIEDTIEE